MNQVCCQASFEVFFVTTTFKVTCFIVIPSTLRHHHITLVLKKLRWLPVERRIKYKIDSITYKSLYYQQPSYFQELIFPVPKSGRRSSSNNLLNIQRVNTLSGNRSFFSLSGILYPIHFVFLHALVHSEKTLKVSFFHLRLSNFFLLLEYLEKLTGLCLDTDMWIGCNSRCERCFFIKYSC